MCIEKNRSLLWCNSSHKKTLEKNLLNGKRFLRLFHSFVSFLFTFNGIKDPTWKIFYDMHEKGAQMDENLMIAPTLTLKVLHTCNYKQNVPIALAIFKKNISAAIPFCFPEH